MTTEAGKRLLGKVRVTGYATLAGRQIVDAQDVADAIPAIEAEAFAAERARIAEAVRGLGFWLPGDAAPRPIAAPNGPFDEVLSRAAVLAIVAIP